MKIARFLPLLTVLVAAGCGGSGQTAPGTGRFVVRFKWPVSTGRVIPTAAQSIVVQVLKNATVVNSALLTPGAPSASFTEVPTGAVTVKATAYPAADGSGNALASASATPTVTVAGPNSVDLTMASTIDHMAIVPNPVALALLGIVTQGVSVTAYDSSNNVILTSPSDISYSTGGSGVFLITTISGNTTVTGLALGTASLIATDAVSGKTATAPVIVTLH